MNKKQTKLKIYEILDKEFKKEQIFLKKIENLIKKTIKNQNFDCKVKNEVFNLYTDWINYLIDTVINDIA